jgi:hypothetical protein
VEKEPGKRYLSVNKNAFVGFRAGSNTTGLSHRWEGRAFNTRRLNTLPGECFIQYHGSTTLPMGIALYANTRTQNTPTDRCASQYWEAQ